MMKWTGGAFALLAVAGCSAQETPETSGNDSAAVSNVAEPVATPTEASGATAEIRDPSGGVVGTATASESGGALLVRIEAQGLPAGPHGVHIHTAGLCEGPAFESAGPHWNPTTRQHGRDNPAGAHLGDLPNLEIGADGTGTVEFSVAGGALSSGTNALLDTDGSAMVIHADADDYRTDPSGNSGGRIACGVFR